MIKKLSELEKGDKVFAFQSDAMNSNKIEEFEVEDIQSRSILLYNDHYGVFDIELLVEDFEKPAFARIKDNGNIFGLFISGIGCTKEDLRKELLKEQDVLYCGIKNYKLTWD